MATLTCRPVPAHVAEAFDQFPERVRQQLAKVREMIFAVADETPGVGLLSETLKWGEPAYLTEATGSGSTIRLGWHKSRPGDAAVYFNCKTSLVATFRDIFPNVFVYSGERAVLLDAASPFDENALRLCLSMALTYHQAKSATPVARLTTKTRPKRASPL